MRRKISVIIPVLNEADTIVETLQKLQTYRSQAHELILVDGLSEDETMRLAAPLVDKIICTQKGRARQQNAGAQIASGDILLFLHADTELPEKYDELIASQLKQTFMWGRFNVRLSGQHWLLRIVEQFMNWRSCLTGIATGDQAIFLTRGSFDEIGGIPEIDIMEDIALSKRLKKLSRPACIKETVITSSRRWEEKGIMKTILFMWSMRLQYFLGVKPEILVKKYYP